LLGFALHNATEGFGIAGVLVGRKLRLDFGFPLAQHES
jgi:zinc transporter ZupT